LSDTHLNQIAGIALLRAMLGETTCRTAAFATALAGVEWWVLNF
jgi:hypothetical protein